MTLAPDLIERAHDAFNAEYARCWRPGGDEADHADAQRAALEAVIALVQGEQRPAGRCGRALSMRGHAWVTCSRAPDHDGPCCA